MYVQEDLLGLSGGGGPDASEPVGWFGPAVVYVSLAAWLITDLALRLLYSYPVP